MEQKSIVFMSSGVEAEYIGRSEDRNPHTIWMAGAINQVENPWTRVTRHLVSERLENSRSLESWSAGSAQKCGRMHQGRQTFIRTLSSDSLDLNAANCLRS